MQKVAALFFGIAFLVTAVPADAQHPIWGHTNTTPQPTVSTTTTIEATPQRSRSFRERVCARVKKRFAHDERILARVNERLQNRFDFICEFQGVQQIDVIDASGSTVLPERLIPQDGATLTVALDPFGPVADDIPRGASNVRMLSLAMTASCKHNITVSSLTISDLAPGRSQDVIGAWVSIDGFRLTRSKKFDSHKTSNLTFRHPYTIPSCETVTFDVRASFVREALTAGRHEFSIQAAEDVFADAEIRGDFPIVGPRYELSALQTGIVSLTYKPILDLPEIGGSNRQVIGKFELQTDPTEEQTLYQMQFENDGQSHDYDFVGIYARATQGRARLTDYAANTVDDFVLLTFDPPFSLKAGEAIDIDLVADIVEGTGSTIEMGFEEPIDIFSVGANGGFGDNGQLYGSYVTVGGTPTRVQIRD